jgi:hypothetical protein
MVISLSKVDLLNIVGRSRVGENLDKLPLYTMEVKSTTGRDWQKVLKR